MDTSTKTPGIRLDKWLSFACIIKTRSKATKACEEGRIRVNDETAKPSKVIKVGDKISVKYKMHQRIFDVLEIITKNVSHAQARTLYREHELSPEEQEALALQQTLYREGARYRPKYKGRPTKRERRKLEKYKSQIINP